MSQLTCCLTAMLALGGCGMGEVTGPDDDTARYTASAGEEDLVTAPADTQALLTKYLGPAQKEVAAVLPTGVSPGLDPSDSCADPRSGTREERELVLAGGILHSANLQAAIAGRSGLQRLYIKGSAPDQQGPRVLYLDETDSLVIPPNVVLESRPAWQPGGVHHVVLVRRAAGQLNAFGAKVKSMITLASGSGLVGFEINGTRAWCQACGPDQCTKPVRYVGVNGVAIEAGADGVFVGGNLVRDIPAGGGITGPLATHVTVCRNTLRRIGRCGIIAGSQWEVRNNNIAWAGIDQVAAGNGEDGILIGDQKTGTTVRSNYIFMQQLPEIGELGCGRHGRHGIAGERASKNTIDRNLVISEERLRGGIVLADGSSGNVVRANVVIGRDSVLRGKTGLNPTSPPRAHLGIHAFGQGNTITQNYLHGSDWGLSLYGGPVICASANKLTHNGGHVALRPVALLGCQAADNVVSGNTIIKDIPVGDHESDLNPDDETALADL